MSCPAIRPCINFHQTNFFLPTVPFPERGISNDPHALLSVSVLKKFYRKFGKNFLINLLSNLIGFYVKFVSRFVRNRSRLINGRGYVRGSSSRGRRKKKAAGGRDDLEIWCFSRSLTPLRARNEQVVVDARFTVSDIFTRWSSPSLIRHALLHPRRKRLPPLFLPLSFPTPHPCWCWPSTAYILPRFSSLLRGTGFITLS